MGHKPAAAFCSLNALNIISLYDMRNHTTDCVAPSVTAPMETPIRKDPTVNNNIHPLITEGKLMIQTRTSLDTYNRNFTTPVAIFLKGNKEGRELIRKANQEQIWKTKKFISNVFHTAKASEYSEDLMTDKY